MQNLFKNPKALRQNEKKLIRLQKLISRKKKNSKNRKKAVKSLAKQHYKIQCIRKDSIHKATDSITKNHAIIGIESLNVKGMVKNPKLAKSISDASFSEFLRQIKYKADQRGGIVVEADTFFPSSKMCSKCNNVKNNLSLSDRIFCCDKCGFKIDRDFNAAINLKNYTASSVGINACGDAIRPKQSVRAASMK